MQGSMVLTLCNKITRSRSLSVTRNIRTLQGNTHIFFSSVVDEEQFFGHVSQHTGNRICIMFFATFKF